MGAAMMLRIYDDFLTKEEQNHVLDYCEGARYRYGESDDGDTPPTGVTHDIPNNQYVHELFYAKTQPLVPEGSKFYRMYVNCFAPREVPYFHTDGDSGVTFLYYPQYNWQPNDGGETQVYVQGNIQGVVPLPNRIMMFDARLLHRATSFRDRWRFTLAIKYE
jgi:hypothetical protein